MSPPACRGRELPGESFAFYKCHVSDAKLAPSFSLGEVILGLVALVLNLLQDDNQIRGFTEPGHRLSDTQTEVTLRGTPPCSSL